MPRTPKDLSDGTRTRSILINFVLDKSGSMDHLREATISGFNEFKNDQTREDGDAFFTLTLFDTGFTTVANAVPIREVPDLDRETYEPGGMTALYDAIGHTLRMTDEFVAAHSPDQVVFVIMTDGEENSSREYDQHKIFSAIKQHQEEQQYEFMFLGANQDSYSSSQSIGMRSGRAMNYAPSPEGSRSAWRRSSRNLLGHRRHGTRLREDYFSPELETLGSIDPEVWRQMPPEERQRRLDEGTGGAG